MAANNSLILEQPSDPATLSDQWDPFAGSDPTRELRLCDTCSKQLLSEQAFEKLMHGGVIFSLTAANLEFLRLKDCAMCLVFRSVLEWAPT